MKSSCSKNVSVIFYSENPGYFTLIISVHERKLVGGKKGEGCIEVQLTRMTLAEPRDYYNPCYENLQFHLKVRLVGPKSNIEDECPETHIMSFNSILEQPQNKQKPSKLALSASAGSTVSSSSNPRSMTAPPPTGTVHGGAAVVQHSGALSEV